MSHSLIVRPSAKRDISEAVAYYKQHGKSEAFIAALDQAFLQIAERPLMYPIVYADVRAPSCAGFRTRCSSSSSGFAPSFWPSITSGETQPQDLDADTSVSRSARA